MRRQPTFIPLSVLVAWILAGATPAAAQLGPVGTAFWNEGSPDLVGSLQADVRFGAALAAGDFNCDGFDDLAIGIPDDDDNNGALVDVGYVLVLYSDESGPAAPDHQLWDQQSLAAMEEAAGDHFGEVLAAGDFDDDNCDDLVIGMPHEDIGSEIDAGGLQVIYGDSGGLSAVGNVFFRQGTGGISAAPEQGDFFGWSVAVGDFDADGVDDLAIGVPGEDIEAAAVVGAGAIHVLFGSAVGGLSGDGDLTFYRGNGLPGAPEENERLGDVLAAGEFVPLFPGDDLAIGAPRSGTSDDFQDEGRVLLLSDVDGNAFVEEYTQSSAGVPGVSEDFDNFGESLAAGDFDGDGIAELAVGSPGEDLEALMITNAGAIAILDFDGDGHQQLLQEDFPFEEPSGIDEFGTALVAGDFDADGADDLAIGVPLEDLGPVLTAGIVHVVHGAIGAGFDLGSAENWIQTLDPSEDGDRFGFALATGHFAGHSGSDLAIGVPTETLSGFGDAGGVNLVLSIALLVDGFESDNLCAWSAVVGGAIC